MASKEAEYSCTAAIFGVTGLVGRELARALLSKGNWKVYGVARRQDDTAVPVNEDSGRYSFVSCDLLNPLEAEHKLSVLTDVTHIFWITWATQFPYHTSECYEQNKEMMANALNAILPKAKGMRHVSLQTGLRHYDSQQGSSDQEVEFYDEEAPRATMVKNFYYALEDLLQETLPTYEVSWSIHRPGIIMGCSKRTFYNFIGTICAYGTICKYLNLPFVFGGTKKCWEEMYVDTSDARLVAEQHIWVATSDDQAINGQAFNAVDGESYTWKEIWPAIGAKLGLEVQENSMFSEDFNYASAMADKGDVWKEIVAKEGLVQTEMEDLANWHLPDYLLRFPAKMMGTRSKVDALGFKTRYHVLDSIFYWIDVMRNEKLIP